MEFLKYQHIEKFGNDEVDGINAGECYVFPKIDGTNGQLWNREGVLCAGSRNRELTLDNDNQGFFNSVIKDDQLVNLMKDNDIRVYGEWLVPHTLKSYRDNAWRKFYIFDVTREINGVEQYLLYEEYKDILDLYDVNYIEPIAEIRNGALEDFVKIMNTNTYLIDDGKGVGEGIVIKNYGFTNKFGRQTWAKIVANEFKEKHSRTKSIAELQTDSPEERFVSEHCTSSFIDKEYSKIINEYGEWTSKFTPRLLNQCYHELVVEELWNFLKANKNNIKIDFRTLSNFTTAKIKQSKPELF
jgi:hypothetical protein